MDSKIEAEWQHLGQKFLGYSLGGLGLGFVVSLIVFNKKLPACLFGTGLGGGLAYSETESAIKKNIARCLSN